MMRGRRPGDVAGAIAAYEETLAREPGNTRALRQAAELCARAGQPERAAALFMELRRRLAERFPGTREGEGALVALRRLRAERTNERHG